MTFMEQCLEEKRKQLEDKTAERDVVNERRRQVQKEIYHILSSPDFGFKKVEMDSGCISRLDVLVLLGDNPHYDTLIVGIFWNNEEWGPDIRVLPPFRFRGEGLGQWICCRGVGEAIEAVRHSVESYVSQLSE